MHHQTSGVEGAEVSRRPVTLFESYRREDAGAHAVLLAERLKARFGKENVFLDVTALAPGVDWRAEIDAREDACGVVIALIGPRWLEILQRKAQKELVEPVDDVGRREIEFALTNEARMHVVPVLVDGAAMPAATKLPRSLRGLADRQAERLRLESYDEDIERLISRLEQLTAPTVAPAPGPSHPRVPVVVADAAASPREATPSESPTPEPATVRRPVTVLAHHQRVARLILGSGHVVVILGSGVNADCPLPSAEDLAADLARRFSYAQGPERPSLPQVAEYVDITWGKPDLYLTLKEQLAVDFRPTQAHVFLANLPALLEATGAARRHQLILTTNYDTALERAFQEAHEPFDLAVYSASTGRFVHVPWDQDARQVVEPNSYSAFPIYDDMELSRSVIVKIHGAVGGRELAYGGHDDPVVTEDHYIDYLSGSSIDQIVPFQILQTLRSSHCLFLGYNIRDWNRRVFLMRIWHEHIKAASWAVQKNTDEYEQMLWRECGAEVVAEPVGPYVEALRAALESSR